MTASFTITHYQPQYDQGLCALDRVCEPIRKRLSWAKRHQPFDPEGVFVALKDGRVVGSAMARVARHRVASHRLNGKLIPLCYCVDVAVDPECQGRGLATELSQKVFDYASMRGAVGVFLYTDKESNPKAYGLYKKLGFQEISQVEMLLLAKPNCVPATDLQVRPAQDSEDSWVRSLLEKNDGLLTFYSPDSPLQFSTPSSQLASGNATFVVEKSGQSQGAFSVFHYGDIWQYQTPLGYTTPLLLHNAARIQNMDETEFWSAIVWHLRSWQASYPMIGLFVDVAERRKMATLKQLGFQKLQCGQWYFKSFDPTQPWPSAPVSMGFPL